MRALVIVQNNPAVDRLTGPVSRRARERGVDLIDLDLGDGLDFARIDADYAVVGPRLLHGSVGFLRVALSHPPLAERLSWDPEAFLASRWASAFGSAYIGDGGRVMPAISVSAALERGGRLAVRPELGLKDFVGGVHDAASWRAVADALPGEFPCFAMGPSEILSEHRVWFVGGSPVAGSRYRADGRFAKDAVGVTEAMGAASDLVGEALPLEDVVVDVALTPSGWRIIELNCIHTSGWHAVDPAAVVDALIDASPVPVPRP
jgi:hypothetical protein